MLWSNSLLKYACCQNCLFLFSSFFFSFLYKSNAYFFACSQTKRRLLPLSFAGRPNYSNNRTRQPNLSILFYSTRSFFVGVAQLDHNVRLIFVDQIRQRFYLLVTCFQQLFHCCFRFCAECLHVVCKSYVVYSSSTALPTIEK